MIRRAVFSKDKAYRYVLWRNWSQDTDANKGFVLFICLNPSLADGEKDDQTTLRCIGFAKKLGFSATCIANLFAYQETKSRKMKQEAYPIGERNDGFLRKYAQKAQRIIVAWGNDGTHRQRHLEVLKFLPAVECLGITAKNHPRHPSRLSSKTQPKPYSYSDYKK